MIQKNKHKLIWGFIIWLITIFWIIWYTKNILIKFNEYEFITYLFDSNREEKFKNILNLDIKDKENKEITVKLWNDLLFKNTFKNLWISLEYNQSDIINFPKLNSFNYIKNLYFSENWLLINNLQYKLKVDEKVLKEKILEQTNSLDKETFKRYYIKDYILDETYWLVGVEKDFTNFSFQNTNNFSTIIDISNLKYTLIDSNSFFNYVLEIPTINKSLNFENKYQSKIQNYNEELKFKIIWSKYYDFLLNWEKITISSLDKNDLIKYLNINQVWDVFSFKDSFFSMTIEKIKKLINSDTYFLEDFSSILKYPDEINWQFLVLKNTTSFISYDKINDLKNILKNENIFKIPDLLFLKKETSIELYFKYKKSYEITTKSNFDWLTCSIINWLDKNSNIVKRLNYKLQEENNFTSIQELEEYKLSNQEELNDSLNIITKLLLYHSLQITNENNSVWKIYSYKTESKYNLLNLLNQIQYDYISPKNNLSLDTDKDFTFYCWEKDWNLNIVYLTNEKDYQKNIFWPVLTDNEEKWTIDIKWKISTPTILLK